MFDRPFDRFLSLDEFITPDLMRPFYLLAIALAALTGLVGALGGLLTMLASPIGGLFTVLLSVGGALVAILGIRMGFEAYIAIMRLHARFVGGHPADPIPD